MDLDDTILQSKTTINLVLFIKELWHANKVSDKVKLQKDYNEIVERTRKAAKKRSIKMKYQEI